MVIRVRRTVALIRAINMQFPDWTYFLQFKTFIRDS